MREENKAQPQWTPWSKPFWDGCKQHKLLIQKCQDCMRPIFYPKLFCPFCLSSRIGWFKCSGRGKIYTYAVIFSYAPSEFDKDVPYIVAVIELEERVRMMSNIIDCSPEKIACDMQVEVVFDKISGDLTLPKFRPVS